MVEISDYYTGDTVELPKDAHHTSEGNSSIIYTHVGWYISADSTEKNTEPLTIYTIPMPEETTEVEPLTIDLYPAWDISVSTIGKITGQNISTVLEEIKKLHGSDTNYCANVEISSEASIDNTINIPDGVTVKFDKAVTVAENGCLTGNIEKAEEVTVVKVVSNNNATNATKGLNVSLNNENYDEVQIKEELSNLDADIKIEESSETVLNLNGFNIKMKGGKSFENSGTLTVINSSNEKDAVLSATSGIKNNGNLTIGEKSDETPEKNIIIRNYTTGSTEATITNGENATLTIESGKIENVSTSAAKAAVNNEKGGTLVVEGGVIDASSTAKTPALLNEGVATITGGEFNRSKNQTTKGQGYYVVVNHGELEITGGDFKANTDSATSALIENGYYTAKEGYGKEESNLTITGGSFTAGRYTIKNDYAGNATIYGGNYSAKAATSDADNGTETRSIFKTIGEMTLDFRNATKENTLINLGDSNSKTALVLVGDQKLTTSESSLNKMVENKITVYPFDSELVKLNDKAISEETNVEEALKQLIVVEKGKSEATNVKSEIIVHVEHEDAKVAGEQLMTLFKNYIAKEMQGASADKNIVKIILDTDVEITAGQDILTGYENTKENTTLDLHGKTLKIPALYIFNHDVHVEDSSDKSGKIVLNSALTENKETEIFKGGEFIPEEQLKAIADSERD